MLPAITVSDLQEQNKLTFRRGDYNILDCGIRTGKTYWAANNLVKFTRDGKLNRVLFLTDTTSLKINITEEYDTCVEADDLWENAHLSSWGEQPNKIGVMCYQRLGSKFLKGYPKFLDEIDVICWDECDSIFDYAVDAFVKAKKKDYAREGISNMEILNNIQEYSSNKDYMPLVMLGAWEKIIEESRIMCIGLSATPERAYTYYKSLVMASYKGKLEAGFRLANDIYFCNLFDHIRQLHPEPTKGYWCYSPLIETNKKGVNIAKEQGFNAIEIHSPNNTDKPMDAEQMRVYKSIVGMGIVPPEYDFVIVTSSLARGVTIIDERFNHLIIDSVKQVDRTQAARQKFEYQRHLKVLAPEIPEEYMNTWLQLPQCRELAEYLAVTELDKNNKNTNRIMTWNKLKEFLPSMGYKVEAKKKRINGKLQQCYYISGKWHDVEIKEDQGFLELVAAHEGKEQD